MKLIRDTRRRELSAQLPALMHREMHAWKFARQRRRITRGVPAVLRVALLKDRIENKSFVKNDRQMTIVLRIVSVEAPPFVSARRAHAMPGIGVCRRRI